MLKLDNLRNNYDKLIEFMKCQKYNKDYIYRVEVVILDILKRSVSATWNSYSDIYCEYNQFYNSEHTKAQKRTVLNIIKRFDIYNEYPNGRDIQHYSYSSKYDLLCDEFKSIVDYYIYISKLSKISIGVKKNRSSCGASFLFDLQQNGITDLSKVSEKSILALFRSSDNKDIRGYGTRSHLKFFLTACIPLSPPIFTKILSFLPELRRERKNIQYLTAEELEKIKHALDSHEFSLSLRDRAIIKLALYTGLRISDIAGLLMTSIDWVNDLISIRQQKTNIPLVLPLTAIVGNAIEDYLRLERPKNDSDYVFLSECIPYKPIKSSSIENIVIKMMKLINIRQEIGDKKGFHIFRHNFVAKLLQNDIPHPVITATLGHLLPSSIEPYLNTDFKHLKEMGLSIQKFPISEDIFKDD